MNISEMHVWFRQYAQQMGMQNVRAILPEQIDLLINTSIIDTVNQIITQTIGVTNDRLISDGSKIGQINALKTLYKVEPISVFSSPAYFKLTRDNVTKGMIQSDSVINDYMYLVDFALDYKTVTDNGGMTVASGQSQTTVNYSDTFVSKYYPVRLVDDAYLADTLNDFIMSPRLRSPIITVNANTFDLYLGDFEALGTGYTLTNKLVPYTLRISYIAKPVPVKYGHDIGVPDVNCNLPEYLHIDILKHAVDLWRNAVGGSQPLAQQAQGQGGGTNNPNADTFNS